LVILIEWFSVVSHFLEIPTMKRTVPFASVVVLLIAGPAYAQSENQPDQQRQQSRFAQAFTLPSIEFDEKQKTTIGELQKKYVPKLAEIQRQMSRVGTPQQRQARREAQQAARQAGKRGAELQEAVDKAAPFKKEQQQQIASLRAEQQELVVEIRRELQSLLTDAQRAQLQRRNRQNARANPGQVTPPTHRNVRYGPHDRNVMDVWLADSDKPTPVLVSIHGGGFRSGNKSVDRTLLEQCLQAGISVAAITYRLSDQAIAPAQFLDSARAVQYIRHQADEWNLDARRIAATGSSAGAGISLWLGFHDDLADPDNDDPVLRQSTRLICMSVYNGQTSYDPRFIRDLISENDTYKHPALPQLFGVAFDRLDDLPAEKHRLFELVSPMTHLSKGDAPAMLSYGSTMETPIRNQGVGIHHPRFAAALKERMDELGIECRIHTGMRRGSDEWAKLTLDFIKSHFAKE
jgi:acetyl esterase